nr:hypothetical protein [Tanacetum cinerariifolium]
MSAVLTTEREAKQMLVYFVSRALEPKDKLHTNGKVGTSFGACKKTAKKILPGTPNHCHYGPTNQADFIVECPKDDPPDTPMEAEEKLPDP